MTVHCTIAVGSPRFTDPRLAGLAGSQGAAAAWLAAWQRDGDTAALAAAGDFAFALRDDASGRALLAVDRFATKTLCWRVIDGQLHCAERADELAALPPTVTIEPQALFDYLYFHVIPSPRTVFRGVHRLPPAHCAVFENGQLSVRPYWVPRFAEPAHASFEPLAAEFRAILRQAVADQLDGSTPACFLSGGTDSSTVAGMIADVTGQPPATYSIGFEAEGYDEMAYARIAAKRFGTQHHEYYVTPDDLVQGIPLLAAHYDQPFGNSSALPAYFCALRAREDGVTKLLAGDGGDELFGGNARYAKQRLFSIYDGVPGALRSVIEPLLLHSPLGRAPLIRKAASYVEQARVPLPDRMQMYNLLQRLGVADVVAPGLLAMIDTDDPLRQQREVWRLAKASNVVALMLAFDWRYTLAEADLPKVCGSAAMAGMAVGFPLLDDRLLEFSMRLPVAYKLKGLKLRWFFKEALRGFLPDEILTKKKHGFGLPVGVWASQYEPLRKLAADSLGSLASRGVVREPFVKALMNEHLPNHPGYFGEMVWVLMMLEQWLRRHAPGFALRA